MSSDHVTSSKHQTSQATEFLTCRRVLSLMVCFGFMFNYMLRVNLTLAIVDMVERTMRNSTDSQKVDISIGKFDWNEYEQNIIIGSFFWGYLLTELPGGRLAETFGTRRVFGYSMLAASLITLLTPFAAYIGYLAVTVLRALLGLMLGVTWPAIHPLAAIWIPPNERSKFLANMLASSLGAALTLPTCGYLIDYFGWPSVFYLTGVVSFLWSILWFVLIYEKPELHPRISKNELNYILESTKISKQYVKPKQVPWKEILTSKPVWAIILTHGFSVFGFFTIVNQLPTYIKFIHHFNIKENGILSSLPYLGKYLFAVFTSNIADYLRTKDKLTLVQIRKGFTTLAVLTPGLIMFLHVFIGYSPKISITLFTAALTVNGAVTAGYLSNALDIAPNFAGTIFGLANTLSSTLAFFSSMIVAWLTYENQTIQAWNCIFGILFVTYTLGATVFIIFGQVDIQSWNHEKMQTPVKYEAIPLEENC